MTRVEIEQALLADQELVAEYQGGQAFASRQDDGSFCMEAFTDQLVVWRTMFVYVFIDEMLEFAPLDEWHLQTEMFL